MTIFISIFTVLEPVIGIANQFSDACTKSIGSARARRAFPRWCIAQASGAGIPTPELPGARLAEDRHSGDRKLESELDGHIVCAWLGPAALI